MLWLLGADFLKLNHQVADSYPITNSKSLGRDVLNNCLALICHAIIILLNLN